jgi:hypothetical protein
MDHPYCFSGYQTSSVRTKGPTLASAATAATCLKHLQSFGQIRQRVTPSQRGPASKARSRGRTHPGSQRQLGRRGRGAPVAALETSGCLAELDHPRSWQRFGEQRGANLAGPPVKTWIIKREHALAIAFLPLYRGSIAINWSIVATRSLVTRRRRVNKATQHEPMPNVPRCIAVEQLRLRCRRASASSRGSHWHFKIRRGQCWSATGCETAPQFPWCVTASKQVFQCLQIFERIAAAPESAVGKSR